MNLWRYVPAVKRPWNPAYRPIWDRMTHRHRQISFLIDVAIVAAVFVGFLAGRAIFP